MISWGLVSGAMMFVSGWWSFAGLRLLLGVAEAGFFPGIILYLTYWFPARQRGRVVALFMIASPTAGMLGNPISGSIMHFMNGAAGLAGWQWLFLIEAIPSVVLGVVVWWFLTDRPEQAHWLTARERDWLIARMSNEDKRRPQRHFLQALAQPGVWLLCGVYFLAAAVSTNGVGFFLPSFIKSLFPAFNGFQIGWLAAIPSLAGILGMIGVGLLSDRTGERRGFVALSALMGAGGLVLSASLRDPWLSLGALAFAYFGMFAVIPTFWALATHNLTGTAAAGSIALINSLANFGGFLSPHLVGTIREQTGSFAGCWWLLAGSLVLGSILVFWVPHDRALEHS
jgi:MFS family permease